MATFTIAPTTIRAQMPSVFGSITLHNDATISPPDSPLSYVDLSLTSLPNDLDYQSDPHHLPGFDSKEYGAQRKPVFYLPPLLSLPLEALCLPEPAGSYRPYTTYQPDFAAVTLDLHKALHRFRPITENHAEAPFDEAFNWEELYLPEDTEREWFAVVTHSKTKNGSDDGRKSSRPESSR
ncbi:uncharacterized protein PHACADRAFT_257997 [Phanerochaete carnosa HHB-10118-sp]|uniref:Uncharacterized protein n=1 Tax=Phanerochaete carnosa (strain HHB-10118-sp) TaxID=650164 RepID=K5W558_PHACS|nr:uncharacterized protein PHACADRAFT_257997 [Phanerochaete carnosa HHB-10118-sp]EKM54265.1 hypothetical protein PHACADRAFT_257997 [Phanerochaete carnosa HHB-10118-sp]